MRLSLKAKVLALAVVPVLVFAVVISLTTVWILQGQARNEVDETRQRLLNDAKATLQGYVEVAMTTIKPLYDAAAPATVRRGRRWSNCCPIPATAKTAISSATTRDHPPVQGQQPGRRRQKLQGQPRPNGVYVNRDLVKVGRTAPTTCNTARPSPARPSWCPSSAIPSTCPSGTWRSAPR